MIDRSTGEPIHIDLGVAFDQGKRLAIPETVPFRLTRDIVDGFGVTGVEGMFKKSCEHTLRVLRTNKEHIISILMCYGGIHYIHGHYHDLKAEVTRG